MKIKVTAHVHLQKFTWEDKPEYVIFNHKLDDTDYRAYICEQEIELEIPDNFDPRAQQVAALEEKKQKVMADYQQSVTEINRRISELQALEYTA